MMNLPDQHLCPSLRGSLVDVLVICCALFLRVENSFRAGARPPKVNPIPRSELRCTAKLYLDSPYLTNDEWPEHPELLWFVYSSYAPPRIRDRQMVSCRRNVWWNHWAQRLVLPKNRPTPTSTPLWHQEKKTRAPRDEFDEAKTIQKSQLILRLWDTLSSHAWCRWVGCSLTVADLLQCRSSEMGTHRSFCLPRGRGAHSAPEWRRVADLQVAPTSYGNPIVSEETDLSLGFLINWTVIRREKKRDTVIHHFLGNQTLAGSMATEPIWTYHT